MEKTNGKFAPGDEVKFDAKRQPHPRSGEKGKVLEYHPPICGGGTSVYKLQFGDEQPFFACDDEVLPPQAE